MALWQERQKAKVNSEQGFYGFGFRVNDRGFDQIRAASSYHSMDVGLDKRYRADQAGKRGLGIRSHKKTHIPSYCSQ